MIGINYNELINEDIKRLKKQQEFLISFNKKKQNEINNCNVKIQEKQTQLDELETNIGDIINKQTSIVYTENKKVLDKITKWEKQHKNKEDELYKKEKELEENAVGLIKNTIMINEIEKQQCEMIDRINKAKEEIENNMQFLSKQSMLLSAREEIIIKKERQMENEEKELKKIIKYNNNKYKLLSQKNNIALETIKKQKQVRQIEDFKIKEEWKKIEDQWKQLKNAKNYINN